jgi:hypothetical protein
MLIFLVVTHYKDGSDERAFSSLHEASAYAERLPRGVVPEIFEVPVIGEQEREGVAYTLRWDDLSADTRNIENVYGDYRSAHDAVGSQGYVQELQIETSADAALHRREPQPDIEQEVGADEVRKAMSLLRRNRARRQRAALHRLG